MQMDNKSPGPTRVLQRKPDEYICYSHTLHYGSQKMQVLNVLAMLVLHNLVSQTDCDGKKIVSILQIFRKINQESKSALPKCQSHYLSLN